MGPVNIFNFEKIGATKVVVIVQNKNSLEKFEEVTDSCHRQPHSGISLLL